MSGAGGTARGAGAAGCGGSGRRRGWGCVGVCVCPRAARGREARAPPPPAAHSAARGPPVRAHCSRPRSTGREKPPEPFGRSASALPSAPRAGGLQGGSGRRPELAPGLPRGSGGPRRGGGAWRPGPTALLPLGLGTGVSWGPLHGPTFLRSRRLPGSLCCCLREPRAHPRGGVGGGGGRLGLFCWQFRVLNPGMYLPKYLVVCRLPSPGPRSNQFPVTEVAFLLSEILW